ncbi:MAG: endonuclease Q family protein [Candidatus Chromulinivorax sp.]|nr:endonuclease Q family protein [Candidatus Chromulinivorax sp.]
MLFLADFHIHSKYSYATSKTMDLQALATWGRLKGLTVMGTGDFTHPVWQKELQEKLIPSEQQGLFQLTPELQKLVDAQVYASCGGQQRFLLTAEIATIFRRTTRTISFPGVSAGALAKVDGGQQSFIPPVETEKNRCYKTHSIIFAPSLDVAAKISAKLAKIGNISYDGRPILSYDVKDLLQLILDISPDCMLIPAHIWTPHFGLIGSKSGFNSVEECFGDMTQHIYALEKGLSSSYAMNAQLSDLDKFALLCNSDAHSVQNLGREANVMNCDLSYKGITDSLKANDPARLVAGIEFFPEMGKYYGSGHRACNFYASPEQTAISEICGVCKKSMTIGVAHRVAQLADRSPEQATKFIRQRYRVAPLQEIIAIHFGVQDTSKKVQAMYQQMLAGIGNEFYILLDANLEDIAKFSTVEIAQSICAMRQGNVSLTPGYDGVYGEIRFKV